MRAYREDADKKRLLVRKADATRDRLVFLVEALRKLFADENFVTLLRAEGLDSVPRNLADRSRMQARPDDATKAALRSGENGLRGDRALRLAIADIQPLRLVTSAIKKSPKYAQIASSIREVGIIEPPVVARDRTTPGKYLLLDGHLRIEVLKDMGETQVFCLISTDDEAFTYNKRVNRLAIVQEHRMILNAIERGAARRSASPGPSTST